MLKTDYCHSNSTATDKRENLASHPFADHNLVNAVGNLEIIYDLAEERDARIFAANARANRALAVVEMLLDKIVDPRTAALHRLMQEQLENIVLLTSIDEPIFITEIRGASAGKGGAA